MTERIQVKTIFKLDNDEDPQLLLNVREEIAYDISTKQPGVHTITQIFLRRNHCKGANKGKILNFVKQWEVLQNYYTITLQKHSSELGGHLNLWSTILPSVWLEILLQSNTKLQS